MSDTQNILAQLSAAVAEQSSAVNSSVVAIRFASGSYVSAILWQPDVVVTSEQSLPERAELTVDIAGSTARPATVVGRDPGTNIAVLRLTEPLAADSFTTVDARVGVLVLAHGADGSGGVRSRLGIVNSIGPQWHSRAGGRIDRRIVLDIRLSRAEEGGPVLDATGAFIGMSTLGPPGQVLVIPAATIERVVPILLRDGRIARGWLGVALQPVAVPDSLQDIAGQRSGMMVMTSVAGGPATKAGVLAGDILLTIDGASARRVHRHGARFDAESIGQEIELRLIRGGAVTTLRAVVGVRP